MTDQAGTHSTFAPAFYLGDAVAPISLERAQGFVDLIVAPPPSAAISSTSGRTRGGSAAASSSMAAAAAHPFRQVLDALRAVQRRREEETATAVRRAKAVTAGDSETSGATRTPAAGGSDAGASLDGSAEDNSIGTATGDGPRSSRAVRADLRMHFGHHVGSALYRDWVRRPPAHLQATARNLAAAVVQRLPPSFLAEARLAAEGNGEEGFGFDVHVQMCPSLLATASLSGRGFAAIVAIRRSGPLAQMEVEQAAMETRLLSVAAAGQTLASSLSFWQEVSYGLGRGGDTEATAIDASASAGTAPPSGFPVSSTGAPEASGDSSKGNGVGSAAAEVSTSTAAAAQRGLREAGIAHCAALGLDALLFDTSASFPQTGSRATAATAATHGHYSTDGAEGGGRTYAGPRKRGRDAADAAVLPDVTVVPGTWPSVSEQFLTRFISAGGQGTMAPCLAQEVRRTLFDAEGAAREDGSSCQWLQPDALVVMGGGGNRPNGRPAARVAATRSLGNGVRVGSCGLVAVVYVTVEGMAYLAYPYPCPPASTVASAPIPVVEAATPVTSPASAAGENPRDRKHAPSQLFLLESSESFTRGLLGL